MNDADIERLMQTATGFRAAIERTFAESITPRLPYFPEGACKLVTKLMALHLLKNDGARVIRIASGHFPGKESFARHSWLLVDGTIVDLTADPFGEAPVVVATSTAFHDSFDERDEFEASEIIAALNEQEAARCQRLLAPIEARLPDSSRSV
jgi:hypothetical protein